MLTDGRQRIDYVCALAIALFFPLALRLPPADDVVRTGADRSVLSLVRSSVLAVGTCRSLLALVGTLMWRGTARGNRVDIGNGNTGYGDGICETQRFRRDNRGGCGHGYFRRLRSRSITTSSRGMLQFLSVELRQMALTPQMPGVYTLQQQSLVLDTMNRLADKLPYYFPAAILLSDSRHVRRECAGGQLLSAHRGNFRATDSASFRSGNSPNGW